MTRTPKASSRCFRSLAARLDKSKFSDMLIFDPRDFESRLSTLSNSNSQIAGTTLLRYKNTDGQNLEIFYLMFLTFKFYIILNIISFFILLYCLFLLFITYCSYSLPYCTLSTNVNVFFFYTRIFAGKYVL